VNNVFRRLVVGAATAALALGVVVAAPAVAQAASTLTFNAGRIISDGIFYAPNTMTAAQVQAFFQTKGASCTTGGGNTCIKDYVETTPTRAADAYCAAYQGATNERASDIVVKAAVACGLNPQDLIVILQKEQSLVTTAKPPATYAKALGFGCPDTSVCDPQYAGFANQVYSAARQFQRYAAGVAGSYKAGVNNTILYNPNTACGSSTVFIQNQATAGLYDYTPYQPNPALLAGTPDSCSSYGNYNFWNLFTSWFGPTTDVAPTGFLDSISATDRSITVSGWAVDPDTTDSITVHVYVDPGTANQTATPFVANGPRPDLVTAGISKTPNHGYAATVPASLGTHQVCVWAIDDYQGVGSVGNTTIGCRSVTVVNHPPVASVESVEGDPGSIHVTGWALDPDTATGATVQVSVDGTVASTTATVVRQDISTTYGFSGPTGFDYTTAASPGAHQVCASVLDSLTSAATSLGCWTTTLVAAQSPLTGTGVVPISPVRLADAWTATRPTTGRCLAVSAAGVPAGATGVLLNVAAVQPPSQGNVAVFPDDGTAAPVPPLGSSVNIEVGQPVANAAWVQVGANGRICWTAQGGGSIRVLIDVNGYTTSGSGVQLQASQRLLDTRAASHVGELAGPVPPSVEVPITVAGKAGVPADATAVVLTATVVGPAGVGNLRLFPTGSPIPNASNINYAPYQTKAAAVLVPIGTGGKVSMYSQVGAPPFSVDVVLDVTGYVTASSGVLHAVTPTRVLDTRPSAPLAQRLLPTLKAATVASLDLRGTGVVPANATGAILNVTAIRPTTPGNLRVYPDTAGNGQTAPPGASAINYIPGRDIPNLVIVAIPSDGRIDLYSDQFPGGTVDVAIDVVGYTTG
jgi:hypothetical protein